MYVVGLLGWTQPHFRKTRVKSWNFVQFVKQIADLSRARISRDAFVSREVAKIAIQEITCWSNSRVALVWIKEHLHAGSLLLRIECKKYKSWYPPIVGDIVRLRKIQRTFPVQWHGPPWLMQSRENWPTEPVTLIRVTAYCLRFARNCQSPVSEGTNDVNLSVKELSDAEARWLREVQVKESRWFAEGGRTSETIHSASRVQTSNHPPTQSPGDRAANQGLPRQAVLLACWRQSDSGSYQNKILDR
ncbi:conserved hypothetical protein [Trichinella spiralis]|uniref:hypothetical protein n=1 Tax=Trichinella spiralis TaxID=6334 RepID=UPI0001EFB7AC|nr:conserved hypothetical protein [Trichinella spiralis]